MLTGIDANQIYLLTIPAGAAVLLLTEWIHLDFTILLNVLMWHNLLLSRVGFDPAQAQSWYFVRSHSV